MLEGIIRWFTVLVLTFIIGALLSLLLTWPVMLLWNWLMPTLFLLPKITFWQCFGLELLFSLMLNKHVNINSNAK